MAGAAAWTTGSSGEWRGPLWPLTAPGVERSEVERLDAKDGRGLGRRNGGRGPMVISSAGNRVALCGVRGERSGAGEGSGAALGMCRARLRLRRTLCRKSI